MFIFDARNRRWLGKYLICDKILKIMYVAHWIHLLTIIRMSSNSVSFECGFHLPLGLVNSDD